MEKNKDNFGGFTLVEVLVVMAIIAVLIGISIAGLGYAMRRSRNIARQSAVSNMDRSLEAYYSDEHSYPAGAEAPDMDTLIFTTLNEYMEGSWDAPTATEIYYKTNGLVFTVCTNQESFGGDDTFVCAGPGLGSTDEAGVQFPVKDIDATGTCTDCMGMCSEWDPSSGANGAFLDEACAGE